MPTLRGARLEEVVIHESSTKETFMDQELMWIHKNLRDGKFPRDTRDAGLAESARNNGIRPIAQECDARVCWTPGRVDKSRGDAAGGSRKRNSLHL